MVDVGGKPATRRAARAEATVRMAPELRRQLLDGGGPKGEALAAARIAGIQAAKATGQLIPLCHPLGLDSVSVAFAAVGDDGIRILAEASCTGPTGVEMEAMAAASIAALTLYDMGKSVDRSMEIQRVRLLEKRGGRSGHWLAGSE